MVKIMDNLIKMDDLGGFPPILVNTPIFSCIPDLGKGRSAPSLLQDKSAESSVKVVTQTPRHDQPERRLALHSSAEMPLERK